MIFSFFRKKNNNRPIIEKQYGALTAAARMPAFYENMHVPDTVMGRFEMVSVMVILFIRRTRNSDSGGRDMAQEIVDAFFQDIDHSIRELGIGDQGVPKRMKKLAGMFYGRVKSYSEALDNHDAAALAQALQRNFHPEEDAASSPMEPLAHWLLEADAYLKSVSENDITSGSVTLPPVS